MKKEFLDPPSVLISLNFLAQNRNMLSDKLHHLHFQLLLQFLDVIVLGIQLELHDLNVRNLALHSRRSHHHRRQRLQTQTAACRIKGD